MKNSAFLIEIEKHFRVHNSNDCIELETWTDGGVNMFIVLRKDGDSYYNQFKDYVLEFDTDEEIDIHRQDNSYNNAFTIRQSLDDFEAYENRLKSILESLV